MIQYEKKSTMQENKGIIARARSLRSYKEIHWAKRRELATDRVWTIPQQYPEKGQSTWYDESM